MGGGGMPITKGDTVTMPMGGPLGRCFQPSVFHHLSKSRPTGSGRAPLPVCVYYCRTYPLENRWSDSRVDGRGFNL